MLLFEGVGVSGPIPRETSYESMSGPFYLDPEGKREDRHDDEIALWIRTSRGVVVCTGCCHAGLVNTLNHVYRLNGGMRIRAAIGGFHLLDADRSRLDKTTAALLLIDPDAVIPCHCTGDAATAALERALGDRVSPGAGGAAYRF
jgi:7,8-dihydropterin-6-yl-methyl-4-(beta-D-ribofuranosyl)aminobenzene 5'-phosphate synthase